MKKTFSLLFLLLMTAVAHAVAIDVTVTKKGMLEETITQKVSDLESVTSLTVHGPLGNGDMGVWMQLPNLEVLDLGDTQMESFSSCTALLNLQRVVLPVSTKEIDMYTFGYCVALTEVAMPGVEKIGMGAFASCSSLTAVTLPGTFMTSEGMLFAACESLKDVYCYTSDYSGQLFGEDTQGVTLHVHTTLVDYFRQKENFEGVSVVGMTFNFTQLVLGHPTTLSDISYYQGADVSFKTTEQMDLETYLTNYSMGSLTLDAPATPKWQVGRFTLPVSFYDSETNYINGDFEQEEKVYSIATLLNQRTPIEAQQIEVSLADCRDMSWLFFSVPFDVNLSDVRFGKGSWVIRRYDPTYRAAVKTGWTIVEANETLHAGEGYIFMRDYNHIDEEQNDDLDDEEYNDDDYRIILPAAATATKENIFATGDVVVPLKKSAAQLSHNADWNMVGNPYPCYFDISAIKEPVTIYIYDENEELYRAFNTSVATNIFLAPCQTFFVQATDVSQITFQTSGRRAQAKFGLPELTESGDNESAFSRLPAQTRERLNAKPAAAATSAFNPQSPLDPGANYFNPATGEAYFDLFPTGKFATAIANLFGGIMGDATQVVKTVTVTAPMSEWDMLFTVFNNAEKVDLGKSSGFQTIPDGTFFFMQELRYVVLPSCVTAIEDEAFSMANLPIDSKLEQLDLYATTPPTITEKVFAIVKDKSAFVVRVPDEAVAAYKSAPVWKDFSIKPLSGQGEELQSVIISVLTPDGEDISEQCNIVWRNADGSIVGVGNLLEAQTVGTDVSYSVSLPASMSLLYEPISAGTHTVQATGNLITINLTATGVVDLGTRNMQGSHGTVDFTLQSSDPDQRTALEFSDVLLTIKDKQTDVALNDFLLQYPQLQFEQTQLEAGQVIVISASSRAGRFEDTQVEATVNADGDFEAKLIFKERGHARITCTREVAIVPVTALVFDAQGRYASRFFANGNTVTVKDLPDGSYTAVVMEQSQFFGVVASLDDLRQTQLRQGTDYAQVAISMAAGTTKDYTVTVPVLDETRLCHISTESYIATNDPAISIVSTATLKAKVIFKEEYAAAVSNLRLIFTFPEGTGYVNNSLLLTQGNGSFQYSDQRLIVPCQQGEMVRCCLKATTSGTKNVTAMVQYNLNGQLYIQSLGAVTVEVRGIKLNMAQIVNSPDVHVRGYVLPNSQLTIYDGERIIGNTTAKSNGGIDVEVTLIPAFDRTFHDVYAIMQPTNGAAINTETSTVYLDRDGSVLSKVTMIYQDQRLVWNKEYGTVTPRYYDVVPSRGGMTTFTAQLLNPQPDNIFFPTFLVATNDGFGYELPATWDESSQLYTATYDFPETNSLPVGVDFSYKYSNPVFEERIELLNAEINSLMSQHNQLIDAFARSVHDASVVIDTEDSVSIAFRINDSPRNYLCTIKDGDYDELMRMRESNDFVRLVPDTDSLSCISFGDDNKYVTHIVNLTQHEAITVIFSYYDSESNVYGARGTTFVGVVNGIQKGGKFVNDVLNDMDVFNMILHHDEWEQQMLNTISDIEYNIAQQLGMLRVLLWALCPNGDMRVPSSVFFSLSERIQSLESDANLLIWRLRSWYNKFYTCITNRGGIELASAGLDIAGMGIGAAAKAGVFKGSRVLHKAGKIWPKVGSFKDYFNTFANGLEDAIKTVADWAGLEDAKDFQGAAQKFYQVRDEGWNSFLSKCQGVANAIRSSYKECDEELKPHIKIIEVPEEVHPIIDPSGFVYEAVPENRVEGVTATIYYKEREGAAEVQWDAEEYGQQNPLETDAAGLYMWNVPKGLWQVRFEKDGYEPTQTEWLPVPPPQLEINVPLTRNGAPEVSRAQAFTNGVSIGFDRHMQTASLQGITVRQNGVQVAGTVEPVDEANGVVRSVRFRPAADFTANAVELTIPATAKSYVGTALGRAYTATLPVEHIIEGLLVQENAAIQVGQTGYISVTAYPAVAVSGKTLTISTRSPLVGLEAQTISFDNNGRCLVPINGLLPGVAQVTFAIGDLEARADVEVKYHLNEVCAAPVPTVFSGAVTAGTEVVLYCATEGATIYYTTDGSCPCDEGSRKVYTAPIVINEPVTIQAIAVCEGMDDSEVIVLTYTISDASAVMEPQADVVTENRYYNLRGMQMQQPLPRGLYIHVQRTPQGIKSKKVWIEQ